VDEPDWQKSYGCRRWNSCKRYLIHDRDPLFTREFLSMLAETGVKSVRLQPRSPNLNAYAEKFVRTIKESCLDRMILFGEKSLRTAISSFVVHYHTERNHQGLANRLISPEAAHLGKVGMVQRRGRLGGMLVKICPARRSVHDAVDAPNANALPVSGVTWRRAGG
jgi:Integrase core domain